MHKFSQTLATAGGLGLAPYAPGTFGSVGGLGLALATRYIFCERLQFSFFVFVWISLALGLALSLVAYFAIREVEKTWQHDDSRIVIDEVVGQFFSSVWFPLSYFHIVLGFVLFRFFDILKPWPICWVDRTWRTSLGTLVDDLLAAVVAGLALACLSRLLGR